jgi:hypothetical protein
MRLDVFWEISKKFSTVGANETEQSINHSCTVHLCAISLWFFSMDNYVSPDAKLGNRSDEAMKR